MTNKEINLSKVTELLKKKYSGVSIVSSSNEEEKLEMVSTGNLAFDLIADGGVPFGSSVEFIGFSQSGKSLFCQIILANAQKKYGAIGIVVDREKAFMDKRARELGIDTDKVIRALPKDVLLVSDAFSFILDSIEVIRAQDEDRHIVVIIDSISAFDKDVDLEKSDSGRKQKSTKDGLRKLLGYIDDKVMVLIVNHFYYAVGVSFGDPKRASGGEGLKYFNTVRFALEDKRKIIDEKKGNEVIGSWLGIEVIKTRLGPCYRNCYVPFFYESGVPYYGGYARLLADRNYLVPKNKQEFKTMKSHTLIYKDKEKVNEFEIESFLEKHSELRFDRYPEFYEGKE